MADVAMPAGGERAGARRRAPARVRYGAVSVASAIGFIGLWEALAACGAIDAEFFPPPTRVSGELAKLLGDGTLIDYALVSTRRVLTGFAFSSVIGISLGILLGTTRPLRWVVQPVISIIRPLPSLAWIPLSLLWLGIGEEQKYAIVFMGTLAPLVVFVTDATLHIDPLYVRAAQNLGASRLAVMWEVVLPATLPSIVSALKVTLALAWTCIVSAEMVGAKDGLGYLIWNAKDWSNVPQVICGMLAISATVLVLDTAVRAVEHRLIPWQRGQRLRSRTP
jgi:taurine transport system permease protein